MLIRGASSDAVFNLFKWHRGAFSHLFFKQEGHSGSVSVELLLLVSDIAYSFFSFVNLFLVT